MTLLQAQELPFFARQFRFAAGRIVRVRQVYRKGRLDIDLILRVVPSIKNLDDDPKPAKLRLKLGAVEEFRFQKRPIGAAGKLPDAHFGYFQSQFFVSLDTWSLLPGERPGVHDFRASDIYFACRDLSWELVPKKPS